MAEVCDTRPSCLYELVGYPVTKQWALIKRPHLYIIASTLLGRLSTRFWRVPIQSKEHLRGQVSMLDKKVCLTIDVPVHPKGIEWS